MGMHEEISAGRVERIREEAERREARRVKLEKARCARERVELAARSTATPGATVARSLGLGGTISDWGDPLGVGEPAAELFAMLRRHGGTFDAGSAWRLWKRAGKAYSESIDTLLGAGAVALDVDGGVRSRCPEPIEDLPLLQPGAGS